MDAMVRAAMMIQVTTTDSPTGIPPNTGITNAVLELNSSTIRSAISVWHPSSLPLRGVLAYNYLSIAIKNIISNI